VQNITSKAVFVTTLKQNRRFGNILQLDKLLSKLYEAAEEKYELESRVHWQEESIQDDHREFRQLSKLRTQFKRMIDNVNDIEKEFGRELFDLDMVAEAKQYDFNLYEIQQHLASAIRCIDHLAPIIAASVKPESRTPVEKKLASRVTHKGTLKREIYPGTKSRAIEHAFIRKAARTIRQFNDATGQNIRGLDAVIIDVVKAAFPKSPLPSADAVRKELYRISKGIPERDTFRIAEE
jgi:hypothetical protein